MPKLFNNFGTNKQGLIVYGGESSADFGMVIAEPPVFERAVRKQTIYKIPGRNGAVIIQQDAWEDVNRTYKVWLAKDPQLDLVDQINALEAWLNSSAGYQRLEDSFEPNTFRLAYYSSGAVTLSIGGKTITATLTDYINIDCETMNAYRTPTENENANIGGTFPTIEPGANNIGITGTITKATIVPKFFTI